MTSSPLAVATMPPLREPAVQALPQSSRRWGFAEFFVISQTALPALLYLPGSQEFRLAIRFSAFAISLGTFVWWRSRAGANAPDATGRWVAAILVLLAAMMFHPTTASFQAGAAHTMVYFAVLAPFFWAPSFVRSPDHLARLLGLLLLCSGVNSIVGVLQVWNPDVWMPAELSRIITEGAGTGALTYRGPNGDLIVRPPGLFDTPGAVAGPGMFAALLGIVFGLSAIPVWQRIGAFTLSGAGVAAIYLSQVRVSLVVVVVMLVAYGFVLFTQRRVGKAVMLGGLALAISGLSFTLALTLGGESILDRVTSLIAEDPMTVYYKARGNQLEYTLTEMLFQFPFGAGLGRWGMAASYFGSPTLPGIWAEIQITGWMIDGGVLMVLVYGGALVVNAATEMRTARRSGVPKIAACGAVVFAANLGVAIMVISFPPFMTQIGIQYWFLAGALRGVAGARA